MYIRPISEQWQFQGAGPLIREFIDMSLFIKSSKLKAAKGKIKAGKKAKWFLSIEDVLLQNPKNREIKEIYQTSGPNILAPSMPLIPISTDKRKKKWVLIDKKNNELETRKIVKKCNRKILTEHWSTKDNITVPGYVEIEKSNSSLIPEQNSEYNILTGKASRYNTSKPGEEESLLYSLQSIESLDNQLIMDQNFDINLANNLVNSLDCNISSEKATRPFLKKIFEIWNGTNWRLTEIKKLKGVRCNTLQKSKKLATQLKCLSENLLVLKTLVTRRPEIYLFDSCIVCNTGTSETQDHLAECSYYKTTWQNIKSIAIDLVWSRFTKEEKYRCPKHLLHKILIGLSEDNIQEKEDYGLKA
ncbi:33792_t:CDS:2 [Gigaspora margarita]|uniref:33792_t:CDS:1 n=1 Tax=Gigaspora margarita TaxID=4874 RepID=A0ABN7VCI2_GIGMA|nr:33792_t:CDS:2 [Gigaspora margarita]